MEEERKKRVGSSSDIFCVKPSSSPPPSSPDVFASIFPPPPEVVGRRLSSDFVGAPQMKPFDNQAWPGKHVDTATGTTRRSGNPSSFGDGSTFREVRGEQCHLSSSLLYGGRDVCGQSSGNQATSTYPRSKEDGRVEGDGGGDVHNGNNGSPDASRGNWWQGSLYY
ncbi:hypothetical protein MLD38_009666 [Melastoma candidum]|uniref:Uncharacterized protein n=1 Tax=Melastoma candidum TaxID=119954 RepID=A0ACB9S6S8_9MYRT|nr:hypothetical protein MLD38_009666 [Melastoma candidum]